ncbi:MAG: hypothetical protein HC853_07435 [Anaerolineae bacterium]|nr:hypothetical protein [Anaerolineae bacterium]
MDVGIPAPKADGFVSFVGRLSTANDPVVNYFLEVDSPTNVPLINRLANIGMGVGLLTLLVLGMGALVSRQDYALSTNAAGAATARWDSPSAQSSKSMWWFGNLGARYQNAAARQSPVQINTAAHDFTLESLGKDPWTITIKRASQTQPAHIATSSGPLPALRLHFEDERGLLRQGVLVMGDEGARQEILRRLSPQ